MKTTQTVRTIKRIDNSGLSKGISSGIGSGSRTITTTRTRVISGSGGNQPGLLRRSSRGSRVWKKTVLGEKYEYSEKLKEKKNYILYASGMGHERKQIEEIEEMPKSAPPKEKVIEIRQIIDNYGYHETKNVTKKDPRRASITHHERLSTPFERTTLKKISSLTTTTSKPIRYTSISIEKPKFDIDIDNSIKISPINKYNSFTTKQQKNKTTIPPKMYETYKPTKTEYIKTIKTIENKAPNTLTQTRNKINTQTQITRAKTEISKFTDRREGNKNEPKAQPKAQPKYQPKNEPKVQPKYQPKNEPKVQPKYQPKNEPKVQPKYQPKNEPKYQPKNEPKYQPKNEPKYQPKVQPKYQPKNEPKYQLKNEPKYQPKNEPKYQPKNEPKVQPKYQPKNEPKYQPKNEPKYQPKNEPKVQPKYQPKNEPKYQPKSQPKYQPKYQPKNEPKVQPKNEPKVQPKYQPKNEPKYQPKSQPKYQQKTENRYIKRELGDNQTKTETTQDGEYVVKVTTTRTQIGKYGKPEEIPRGGSVPRAGIRPRNEGFGTPNGPHGFIPPHGPFGPHGLLPPHGPFGPHGFIPPHGPFGPHGYGGPHGPIPRMPPKSEERSKSLERPHISYTPHGFMSPHGPHGFIPPHGPFGPHGFGGPHGFMPPHGPDHHDSIRRQMEKEYMKHQEEKRKEERRPISVPKTRSTFESRTFQAKTESIKTLENRQSPDRRTYQGFGPHGPMGPHGPFSPPHGFMPPHGFIPPHGPFGPHHGFGPHGPMGPHGPFGRPHGLMPPHGFMPPHGPHHEPFGFEGPHGPKRFGGLYREERALTEEKKRGGENITGVSQYRFQQTTSKSDRGDNYEYFESKHVIKSGRVNQPITIHHRRGGEEGRYNTPQIKSSENRSSSYNKISSQRESRNQTGTGIIGTKYTQKTTYQNKTINQYSNIKGKEGKGSNTYPEYKNYTKKDVSGKKEGTRSANTSKYGMNQSMTQEKKQVYKRVEYGLNQKKDDQYESFDESEFQVVFCPVHGRQLVRKKKLKTLE